MSDLKHLLRTFSVNFRLYPILQLPRSITYWSTKFKTTGWIIRTKKPGYLQRDTNKNWILIIVAFWLDVKEATPLIRNKPEETTLPLDVFLICENWFRNRMTMFGRVFNLPEFSCNFILEHHEMEIRRCLWRSDIVFQGYI